MINLIRELWQFAKHRKKFWLLPIILVFLALSALIIFTEASVLGPFIYTIF